MDGRNPSKGHKYLPKREVKSKRIDGQWLRSRWPLETHNRPHKQSLIKSGESGEWLEQKVSLDHLLRDHSD